MLHAKWHALSSFTKWFKERYHKTCLVCGKKGRLEKDCWFRQPSKRCFNCGDPNHMRNECPKLKLFGSRNFNLQNKRIEGNYGANQKGNLPKPQVKEKVFVLGQNELGVNPTVVDGTLTLQNCSINVLIGSSHSYINEDCLCHLGWDGLDLPYTLLVSTPLGKLVEIGKYIPGCMVKVGKEELLGDLIVILFKDYDLILGMD
jgi:hypothetical protein